MWINLMLWSVLIVLSPVALDLAFQMIVAIVQGLASILRGPFERHHNSDRLASQSWT